MKRGCCQPELVCQNKLGIPLHFLDASSPHSWGFPCRGSSSKDPKIYRLYGSLLLKLPCVSTQRDLRCFFSVCRQYSDHCLVVQRWKLIVHIIARTRVQAPFVGIYNIGTALTTAFIPVVASKMATSVSKNKPLDSAPSEWLKAPGNTSGISDLGLWFTIPKLPAGLKELVFVL